MHICPYGTMAIFILNTISLLEPKTQNRVRSAIEASITAMLSPSQFSPEAWDDMRAIVAYIATDNPDAAVRFVPKPMRSWRPCPVWVVPGRRL